ncbi:MAG: NAD(P)H-dependent oxidoreductase subunit E [Clostridiaceae bacterium]|nr:NAD(P)H-dependent oxidoreductase subunit E [Eubacteriales bacterium]
MAGVTNARREQYEKLDTIISRWKGEQGGLLPIMQHAQELMGCLDDEVQRYISDKTGASVSTIYGIATFYSLFTLAPKGKYKIGLCLGTACYVRGSQNVIDELQKELKVEVGKTTPDGLFTLDATRCIGCCGLAPAMMINDEVFGRLVPSDVPGILDHFRQKEA